MCLGFICPGGAKLRPDASELVCRHMPCAGAWCNGNGNAMNAWTGEMNPILWLDRWLPYTSLFVTLEFWCQPSACSWAWGFEICCLSSCESFQCLEGYSKKPRAQEFSCQAGPGHPVRSRDKGPWGMAPWWPHGLGSWKHGQVIAKGCRGNTRWIDTDMTQEHVLNMTRNHTCDQPGYCSSTDLLTCCNVDLWYPNVLVPLLGDAGAFHIPKGTWFRGVNTSVAETSNLREPFGAPTEWSELMFLPCLPSCQNAKLSAEHLEINEARRCVVRWMNHTHNAKTWYQRL